MFIELVMLEAIVVLQPGLLVMSFRKTKSLVEVWEKVDKSQKASGRSEIHLLFSGPKKQAINQLLEETKTQSQIHPD